MTLDILSTKHVSNPSRSNLEYYPPFSFGGVSATEIDTIVLLLKGKELKVSADFMTDVVALATIMKGCDPAPKASVDYLSEKLVELAYLSQDLFERTTRVPLGSAIAKVCMRYVDENRFTVSKCGKGKTNLIISDYVYFQGEIEEPGVAQVFHKLPSWPDFIIFYDPSKKAAGVVPIGFILSQFAKAVKSFDDPIVHPSDFDVATPLNGEEELNPEQVKAITNIVTVMVKQRLFTERWVPNINNKGAPFKGWYFCRGCFESYIEKSLSGCKGMQHVGRNGEITEGVCGSLKVSRQTSSKL